MRLKIAIALCVALVCSLLLYFLLGDPVMTVVVSALVGVTVLVLIGRDSAFKF